MRWISGLVRAVAPTLVITLALLLGIDYLAGERLLGAIDSQSFEKKYRIGHPIYHHTLAPNYDGRGAWGRGSYRMCTDAHGFKSACGAPAADSKQFDLAFIGDSFTEGIGLPYEQTFVGRIAAALPGQRVANLGVTSYAPSIYLSKVRALLAQGYRFKELVVYVDISDIQDEALTYRYADGVVRSAASTEAQEAAAARRAAEHPLLSRVKDVAYGAFPLTHAGLAGLKARWSGRAGAAAPVESPTAYLERGFERGAWTYHPASGGYGEMGVEGAVAQSLARMRELHEALSRHGIALSVGVYPWPSQLLHDTRDSRQVRLWREFCEGRCRFFHDSFGSFFGQAQALGKDVALQRLFIAGDVHHSPEGAALVAEDFLKGRGLAR